jgi:hypothetical protein
MTQPLSRRQTGDLVSPQDSSSGMEQHTQAQLDTVHNLIGMGIVEYDRMYTDQQAYVQRPGRSPDHQRYITDRAASLLNTHNVAVDTIIRRAISQTIDTRYVREVEVPRIIEVQKPGIIPRLFGK